MHYEHDDEADDERGGMFALAYAAVALAGFAMGAIAAIILT